MKPFATLTGVMALVCLMVLLCAPQAEAKWPADGKVVCDAPGLQVEASAVSDGAGGAIVFWSDNRSGIQDIYAQRLDKNGMRMWWPGQGVPICVAVHPQYDGESVSDGQGGAIVVWMDQRYGATEMYAQRVDGDGNTLWTANGIRVAGALNGLGLYEVIPDGQGGVIIAWDLWGGAHYDIYAQRLDGNGTLLWGPGGTIPHTVTAINQDQLNPQLAPDGLGGAYIIWEDMRLPTAPDIFGQRVTSAGGDAWSTNGKGVITGATQYSGQRVAEDGIGGAFLVWEDWGSATAPDIHAQRMDNLGTLQWVSPSVLCSAPMQQWDIRIIYDGLGGAIVGWSDFRSGADWDIYGQRVDLLGIGWWLPDGTPVCTAPMDQANPHLVIDGLGGAIFAFSDQRTGGPAQIYSQRIDLYGNPAWLLDGVEVSPAGPYADPYDLVADDQGGAIPIWLNLDDEDLYAQHVDGDGNVGDPNPSIAYVDDVPHDQGGFVTVAWGRSRVDVIDDRSVTHYSVWRTVDGSPAARVLPLTDVSDVGPSFSGPAYRVTTNGSQQSYWEWMGNLDAHWLPTYSYTSPTLYDSTSTTDATHYFMVSAHTEDPFVYWDSAPDSGYSVDNLAPEAPAPLAGEYLYPEVDMRITWGPNDETDLSHYAVYKGTSPGFVPGPGNLLGTTADTVLVDAAFDPNTTIYYKVSAWDVHENESEFSLLTPQGVTGVGGGGVVAFLGQNAPNPFRSTTVIRFTLATPGRVSLNIYDQAGRLVRTLLDGHHAADSHQAKWDGRDNHGRRVSPGVYLYKLDSDRFVASRKLVVLD